MRATISDHHPKLIYSETAIIMDVQIKQNLKAVCPLIEWVA